MFFLTLKGQRHEIHPVAEFWYWASKHHLGVKLCAKCQHFRDLVYVTSKQNKFLHFSLFIDSGLQGGDLWHDPPLTVQNETFSQKFSEKLKHFTRKTSVFSHTEGSTSWNPPDSRIWVLGLYTSLRCRALCQGVFIFQDVCKSMTKAYVKRESFCRNSSKVVLDSVFVEEDEVNLLLKSKTR